MKKLLLATLFLVALSCVAFTTVRCIGFSPSGKSITREYNLASFSEIEASQGIAVTVHIGQVQSVVVTTDENAYKYLSVNVKNDELHLGYKNLASIGGMTTKVEITVPALSEVEISSGASLTLADTLVTSSLSAEVSSGASAYIIAKVDKLTLEASSGASIEAVGSAMVADYESSSGASLSAYGVECRKVDAEATSGGSIQLTVTQQLEAEASSGGSISYKGNPVKVINESGLSGSVVAR